MQSDALRALEAGPVYWFRDWPNAGVPQVAAGVYTVWHGARLVYAGMAGRGLSAAHIADHRTAGARGKGLFSRLNSHASGRRSGDQFCIYVCDRLVLPALEAGQIADIGAGRLSLDRLTRDFIREHLGYRYVEAPDSSRALELEGHIRRGALEAGAPFLNPLAGRGQV